LSNPLFIGTLAISAGIAALTVFSTKMQESIDKMEEETQKSKTLTEALQNFKDNNMTYTESEVNIVEEEKNKAQDILRVYEEKNKYDKAIYALCSTFCCSYDCILSI